MPQGKACQGQELCSGRKHSQAYRTDSNLLADSLNFSEDQCVDAAMNILRRWLTLIFTWHQIMLLPPSHLLSAGACELEPERPNRMQAIDSFWDHPIVMAAERS